MSAHRQLGPPDARIIKVLYAVGLGRLVGHVILLLTTIGRKTGLPRVTPLQYEQIDGAWYVASAHGTRADWFQNILANRHVQVRVKARHVHGIAEPITDPRRIADFLSLRLRRHPRLIGAILRSEGLPAQPSRADLESYAQQLAMVVIRPDEVEDTPATTAEDHQGSTGLTNRWNRFIYRLWAPIYDRAFARLFAAGCRQAIAALAAQPGERLLLSGIGTGADLPLLPAGTRVVGIDLSPAMLARARVQLPRADVEVWLIQADVQALPLRDGACDAALLNLIVSVAPDGGACLHEAVRALRPSGRIVIFDKFLPDAARVGCIRRVLNAGARWFGTDINRRLGDLVCGSGCVVEQNMPSLGRGLTGSCCCESAGRRSLRGHSALAISLSALCDRCGQRYVIIRTWYQTDAAACATTSKIDSAGSASAARNISTPRGVSPDRRIVSSASPLSHTVTIRQTPGSLRSRSRKVCAIPASSCVIPCR